MAGNHSAYLERKHNNAVLFTFCLQALFVLAKHLILQLPH